jgi:hypothetical protein
MNAGPEPGRALHLQRVPRPSRLARGWWPRTWADAGCFAGSLAGFAVMVFTIAFVVAPAFRDLHSLGSHDWDQMESHRYLVFKSVREYGQFPFWNPYGCGGHPSWAGIESGTTIVSPWLPLYLLASLPLALKVEMAGTALISGIGTWLLAGRFTKSPGLRAFCCAVFVVDGRWALQIAAGHTWHLYYAWTPWALFFFDRASGCGELTGGTGPAGGVGRAARERLRHVETRWRDVVLCGASLAMMVYNGAIYPLPETVVALGVLACVLAIVHRTVRPLVVLAAAGVASVGLSAPKLFPVIDALMRFPRLIDSPETMDLGAFVTMYTSRDQGFSSRPAPVGFYGWHEWGIYIGWVAFLALLVGAVFARGRRELPFKWVGLLLMVLGFGAFHEYAPWTLLHFAPIFKSQHVPSRWLYPGTLVLGVVFVAMCERGLARLRPVRPLFEGVLLASATWISWDVATIARLPIAEMFGAHMPTIPTETAEFHTDAHVADKYEYDGVSYGQGTLPSEIANVGQIDCMISPAFSIFAKDAKGIIKGLGAKGRGDPAYRGEAYTASGKGKASLIRFTPNAMTVRVDGATPGDLVVLNQNWDGGWRANGVRAVAYHDAVATVIDAPSETILFRYRPNYWWFSLAVFTATASGIAVAYVLRRRATA